MCRGVRGGRANPALPGEYGVKADTAGGSAGNAPPRARESAKCYARVNDGVGQKVVNRVVRLWVIALPCHLERTG